MRIISATPKTADTARSKKTFVDNFDILASAGVGVILVHAREPHRVSEALREWAFIKERTFREWDCVKGWMTYSDNPNDKPTAEIILDVTQAMLRIDDIPGQGAKKWEDGVFIMQYPHWNLRTAPMMIQLLKQYVRSFSETGQRLVLVVPEGFMLPKELENDIAILHLDLPTRAELREIYDRVVKAPFKDKNQIRELFPKNDVETILSIGSGMTEMEFEGAVGRAIVTNKATFPNIPLEDFTRVLRETKTEVVRRSEVLELMEPGRMEDVGGLDLLKEWILMRQKCFVPEARAFGIDKAKGVALIGPPGTGKSVSAKAISSGLAVPLIRFDVSRVFNSLVGESEGRVRAALKLMEAMAPCVAFIDEVDKAGIDPRQGSGDSGVGKRIMGTLLTFMQETKADIFWILTANRVDNLPPEMLRKGRLDEVFAVMPPNEVERMEVLKIHLRNRGHNPDNISDLAEAVTASKGFVSAELEAAVKEALVVAFCNGETNVTGAGIARQLQGIKPLSVAFKEDFDAMQLWAEQNARPASSDSPTQIKARTRTRQTNGNGSRVVEV